MIRTKSTSVQAQVEQLRAKYDDALNFETIGREIAIEGARLESRLALNQLEQSDQIGRAVTIFGEISRELYTNAGQLIVSKSLAGAPIRIEIPRQDSEGVDMKSTTLGLQYITMMNTDIAAEVATEGFDVKAVAMSTVLSDQENGGLFGKPFGNEPPPRRSRRRKEWF